LPPYHLRGLAHIASTVPSFSVLEIEMDGLSILIGVLIILSIFLIFSMNWKNYKKSKEEGFVTQEKSASDIEVQIRAVLDDLTIPEICPLYTTIRKNMKKNEMSGPNAIKSQVEAAKRVEDALRLKIPGGALPCPLLTYPKAGATDLEWLDFVQKIPIDYGARIVFMAIYAKEFLGSTEQLMRDALSGKGKVPPVEEGFAICSPDVADTRRAEKSKKGEESCELPENLTQEQIKEAVTVILKQIVAEKTTRLSQKKISPTLDILPIIKDATKSADYLNKKGKEAEEGNLEMTSSVPNLS